MNRVYPNSASFLVTEQCNLRCKYCVTGDTQVTLADFSTKAIKDIVVGDVVLGFDEHADGKGKHRKMYPSKVLQLHSREADVLQITLDNGSILNVTDNHPLLNDRGNSKFAWKDAGKYKVGQTIMTLPSVQYSSIDINGHDYITGYFVAMMLGDGTVKQYIDGNGYDAYRVRLAVKDDEIIDRMKVYFDYFGIQYTTHDFKISTKHGISKKAIFAKSRDSYNKVVSIIRDSLTMDKSLEYYCGFLAGIYDAKGNIDSRSRTVRICNGSQRIIDEIKAGLDALNIIYDISKNKDFVNIQTYTIRIIAGDTLDNLRFIKTVQPAVKRKGVDAFYGKAMLTSATIIDIKNLGTKQVYNIGTESRTYIANGFAVHNCFEKHNNKVMTEEVARKGLELLADGAIKAGKNEFHAMIFGGEPLLVPEIVEFILKYGCELAEKLGIQFTSSLVTNATRMNDNIYRIISTYRDKASLGIQLSIDGIQKVQDMYRVTPNGHGSFKMVAKNVPVFKSIYHDKKDFLAIHGCVNKQSLPYLFESYKFFREQWDFSRIWFLPVMEENWDDDDVLLYYNENKKIYDYIMNIVRQEKSLHEVANYAPMDRCIQPPRSMQMPPCGAGKNFITITAEGELYPCHQIYFNDPEKETLIGDVWQGVDPMKQRVFAEYDGLDLSCDKHCNHGNCYKCIAVNWIVNSSIFSQVKGNYCKLSRIDRYFQSQLKEELVRMGLITSDQFKPNKCDNGGHRLGCDVVIVNGKTYDLEIFEQRKAYLDVMASIEPEADLGCGIVNYNGIVYDTAIPEERKKYKEALNNPVCGKKEDGYIVVGSWEKDGEKYEARQLPSGDVSVIKLEQPKLSYDNDDSLEVLAGALKMILMRLDELEKLIKKKVGD